jgi:Fe-S cluster assembly iron-binding protein IscA
LKRKKAEVLMLAGNCERKLSEYQTRLYTDLHRENHRAIGMVVAVADVFLETTKSPLKVIECAILVIVNLGGALLDRTHCSVKHAVCCAEDGVANLAVFVVTWFVLPPVPGIQISPVPVFRLLLQSIAVLRNPATAESVYRQDAAKMRRDRGNINVALQPFVRLVRYERIPAIDRRPGTTPYNIVPIENQPPAQPPAPPSAVIGTTTPASASSLNTASVSASTSSSAPASGTPSTEAKKKDLATIATTESAATLASKYDDALKQLDQIVQDSENSTSVSMTEAAANQYRAMLAAENKVGWGLRLRAKPADGNDFEYFLDYSEKPKEGDMIFESQGIQIHVTQAHAQHFLGTVLTRRNMVPGGIKFNTLQSPQISPAVPPSSQTTSTMPTLNIEPAASATSSATTTTGTGLQTNTEPESPATPPEAKPDEKKPDPKPEMSVSPGTF